MYQHYQIPIKELNELLANFDPYEKNNVDIKIFDIVAHTEADFISELLLHMKLKTPKLTRNFVKKLHSGEESWKTTKNEDRYINQNFDFEILEELGIIYFENDQLILNAKLPSFESDEDIDESVKPLLLFYRSLEDIFYSRNDFTPVTFFINKENYSKIIPEKYKFKKLSLKAIAEENLFSIEMSSEDRKQTNLISDYYWKKIINSDNRNILLESYYNIKNKYSEFVYLPSYSSLSIEEKENLSEICREIIKKSSLLSFPFNKYLKILRSHKNLESFFEIRSHHININLETNKQSHNNTIKRNLKIGEIIDNFNSNIVDKNYNNIEIFELKNHTDHLYYQDGYLTSALLFLIKENIIFDHQKFIGKEVLRSLLDESLEKTTLRHYLINILPVYLKNNNYNSFLLTQKNEFEIGALNLIEIAKQKYYSTNITFVEVKSNISSILSDILSKVSINEDKKNNLVELIIYLAKNRISYNLEKNQFEKDLIEKIIKSFSIHELEDISNILIEKLKLIEVNGVWPHYTLYLLFMILKHSTDKLEKIASEISSKIRNYIYIEYEKYFYSSIHSKNGCLDSHIFYDSLDWDACNKNEVVESFINLKPSNIDLITGFNFKENENSIYYMKSIRSYFQVLMNLHSASKENKKRIQGILLDIIKIVGFKSKGIEFPLLTSDLFGEEYDLWSKFTKILNDLDETAFDDTLIYISGLAPLDKMMSLYSNTTKQERRNRVITSIEQRSNWKLDTDSLTTIETSFLLSLEENKLDIAKISLDAANDFIKNHPWKGNINFKDKIDKWSVFNYKYKILKIFYSPESNVEKITLINKEDKPELEDKNSYNTNILKRETYLFRRYILGLIKLDEDPEISKEIFEGLYKEHNSPIFSHLIFTSNLKSLIKQKSDESSYSNIIKEYISNQEFFDFNILSKDKKSDYLLALLLSGNHDEVNTECLRLAPSEKFYRPITITYIKALRNTDNSRSALSLIQDYKKYHSIEIDDQEIEDELKNIDSEILNLFSPLYSHIVKNNFLLSDKTIDELKTIYNEIFRKPINDLIKIASNSSNINLPEFLYENIFDCLKEILKRGRNLEKLIINKDENSINDWFTSLFNKKMAHFSISLSDQARIGSSESNINVGETDGLITDASNSSISMFEALNLKYIDKTVISKHLNKITKYDRESVSSVFIVSYCYFDDFKTKTIEYKDYIESIQYEGFDENKNNQLIKLEFTSEYYCARESRYRGDKNITIYHLLIDLTLPHTK